MKEILLCSHDPILMRNLYGILRDEGYDVETADHPANAVQMVLKKRYIAVIINPEPFGLSADDAVKIIKTVMPEMPVILVGHEHSSDTVNVDVPVDLREFKKAINDIRRFEHIN